MVMSTAPANAGLSNAKRSTFGNAPAYSNSFEDIFLVEGYI